MTHRSVHEWGRIEIGEGAGTYSRAQANALIAAARTHPYGGTEGTGILTDHHRYMRAQQAVGVLAAPGCSLEILPKVDPADPDENPATVRSRLVQMLDIALGLNLSAGETAALGRQNASLLDILIRLFADRLLAETRRGLPRLYLACEEDLPNMRGRLDVVRQFSVHAVRPERLACRFDALSSDIPLLQVMKACVVFLGRHARNAETKRRLVELRSVLDGVHDRPLTALPWGEVRIDRTNRRWQTLVDLARLFLRREWQSTRHNAVQPHGISLLFPMNDLFETTVAVLLRRALAPHGLEVVAQGGLRRCLGDWQAGQASAGRLFPTKPDLIVRRAGRTVAILDTKWKCVATNIADRKRGVTQADIYQMMAYAQLYACDRLMLLYPHHGGIPKAGLLATHGIAVPNVGPAARLDIATIDMAARPPDIAAALALLVLSEMGLAAEARRDAA